jgi:hypothetical protein
MLLFALLIGRHRHYNRNGGFYKAIIIDGLRGLYAVTIIGRNGGLYIAIIVGRHEASI